MSRRLNLTLSDETHARLASRARSCGYRSAAEMVAGLVERWMTPPTGEEITAAQEEIEGFFMEFESFEANRWEINNRI